MSGRNSQTSEPAEASMKSLSQQVLQWQKTLSDWDCSHQNESAKETPQILQDSEIHNTIHTAVKVLTASLKASSGESSSKSNKDTTIVNASLDVLTKAATQPTAKTLFITSGALKPISELLRKACLSQKFVVSASSGTPRQSQKFDEKKDDDGTASVPTNASSESSSRKTPSMALHCLANLSDDASDAIKNDYLLPIANPLIYNVMSSCLAKQAIQRYSCKMLYHLSNPLLQELVAAGFVEVIWKANQAHPEDGILQHYTNACLYNLLPVCPEAVLQQTVYPQQLVQGLVPGMTAHPAALEVQKYGLLVMTRVATKNTSPQDSTFQFPHKKSNNALQASHALGLPHVIYAILSAINLFAKDAEIAQVGCNLLKHVSRLSTDFCLCLVKKGALATLVRIMQCHLDHSSIQDPVLATLRNLLSLRVTDGTTSVESVAQSIRHELQDLSAMIRVIGLVMSIHVPDAPIQAYGLDAFGRLAALDEYSQDSTIRESLFEGNALRLALQAMRVHPNHLGVQDRAIVLLLKLCSYEPAYEFMRQEKEMDEESDEDDDDDEEEEDCEYGDEYDDESIGPVLRQSSSTGGNSNLSSDLPQSFVYKLLLVTKVSPKCQDRLQQLLSIVDLQDTPSSTRSDSTRESLSGFFSSRLEGAERRMRTLRDSLQSPTSPRASWTSPLKERTSKWWQQQQSSPSS